MTLFGSNLGRRLVNGNRTSTVAIDGRPCVVPSPANWTDTSVFCVAPVGVSTDAMVQIDVGGQALSSSNLAHYVPPTVSVFAPRVVDTAGGVVMTIFGTDFASGSDCSVSVLLRRTSPTLTTMTCAGGRQRRCVTARGRGRWTLTAHRSSGRHRCLPEASLRRTRRCWFDAHAPTRSPAQSSAAPRRCCQRTSTS